MNFIQQAYKGKNEWYLYAIVMLTVVFGWQLLGILPLLITAIMHAEDMEEFQRAAQDNFMTLGIDRNLFLFLMIVMFAVGLLFLFMGIRFIHKRAFKTLITSRKKIDWKRFWFGCILWGILSIIVTGVGIISEPAHYVWNFKPLPFFILVIISFLLLPIQTSFEELLFRGYFMQGLGVLVKNRWFPLLITSLAFGVLHAANPEVAKFGTIALVFYIGTGLFFGIITLMDEGTELALGLHASNNIVSAFFVTTDWMVFQTDALFIDTSEPSVGIELFLPVLVLYPSLLIVFSKKYGWRNWNEKLFGKIHTPLPQEPIEEIANFDT